LSGQKDYNLKKLALLGDKKFGKLDIKPLLVDINVHPRVIPTLDSDKDLFSPSDLLPRGSLWRGRDCDDRNPNVKPVTSFKY
jgi:hypothetical protein